MVTNPLLKSALIVFCFWWFFFTLREFSSSPLEVIANWAYIAYSMRLWVVGLVIGAGAMAWYIYFKRASRNDLLAPSQTFGMASTLGPVPVMAPPKRISNERLRLPIKDERILKWLESAKADLPKHHAFFMAVLDTYAAHRVWPAAPRVGGHGNLRLWEHCLGVVSKAFDMAPSFVFEGVKIKHSGRKQLVLFAPSRPDFKFNPEDPLIPLLALCHDFGKLGTYVRNPDGSFTSRESGTTKYHDEPEVAHDKLGAQLLARLPEFWALPPSDRKIISQVVAHYHHPSSIPTDRDGLITDDRLLAMLDFLIHADRAAGLEEEGLSDLDDSEDLDESEVERVYQAFVDVVTEYGRINGVHGDNNADKHFMIGSKHGDLIAIRERDLRALMSAKLGRNMDKDDGRYVLTRQLLGILTQKGLLYTRHNGLDFSMYAPMWEISHRATKTGKHILSWHPVLLIDVANAPPELDSLVTLKEKAAKLRIERPIYTHHPNIRNRDGLRALIRDAFGEDIAKGVTLNSKDGDTKQDASQPAPAASTGQAASASSHGAEASASPSPVPADAAHAPVTGSSALAPTAAPVSAPVASSGPAPSPAPTPAAEPQISVDEPPWDSGSSQPAAPEPAALPVDDLDLDASAFGDPQVAGLDVTTDPDFDEPEEAPSLDGFDSDGSSSAGSLADAFADFDQAPQEPQATAESAPRVPAKPMRPAPAPVASRPVVESTPPAPADIKSAGKAVGDPDWRRVDPLSTKKSAENLAKLKALAGDPTAADALAATFAAKPEAKKSKKVEAAEQMVAQVNAAVREGRLEIAGENDGFIYIMDKDFVAMFGRSFKPAVQPRHLVREMSANEVMFYGFKKEG